MRTAGGGVCARVGGDEVRRQHDVVVDELYDIAGRDRDAGVARERSIRPRFEQIGRTVPLGDRAGIVGRTVVDDDRFDRGCADLAAQ